MGLLSGLFGNASTIDAAEVQRDLQQLFAADERVEGGYQLIRDLVLLTDKRMILVNKQGLTGKKVEYHSIPYRAITHFSVETAGHFDLEAELKIWISGTLEPVALQFSRAVNVYEVQAVIAAHIK